MAPIPSTGDGELTGFGVCTQMSGRKRRVCSNLRWFAPGQHGRIAAYLARVAALEILTQAKEGIALCDKLYQPNRTLGAFSKVSSLAKVRGMRPESSSPCRHVKRYKAD